MSKLRLYWSNLRSSLWFLPALIVAFSVVLAAALIEVDASRSDHWLAKWPRLFAAGAAGARGVLSTIAASMISVVGVTFSMTLVALALASTQYTSRILRTFMSSRLTQAVLGVFAGIYTYCLIVLRTIRGGDEGAFVPGLAVFFGFLLAVGGVGVLIFFIHHVASSVQASSIIASVADETIHAIERLFPKRLGHGPTETDQDLSEDSLIEGRWHAVAAKQSGYLQSVDNNALLSLARERQTVVRMDCGIGEFVVENGTLVSVALEEPPSSETMARLRGAFVLSRHRTLEQDAAFGIRQLVDVALKALSPGVNDATTAVTCLDYLTTILARLSPQQIASSHRYVDGELRVIAKGPSFQSLLSEAFDQIRESAKGNFTIIMKLLTSLQTLVPLTPSHGRRQALLEHVDWIAELAERTIESPCDRARLQLRLRQVREAFETSPGRGIHN